MDCEDCLKNPSFICRCFDISLCEIHLGKHMLFSGDHRIENLIKVINPSEKLMLDSKLASWVMTLTSLKSEICSITTKIIKNIESQKASLLLKLDNQISQYNGLLSKTKFKISEFKEIKSILSSALVKNTLNIKPLDEAIEEVYSQETFSLISDICKLKENITKKALENYQGGFKCLAISKDCRTLVTGSKDSTVRVWDMESKRQTSCLFGHKSTVNCVCLFANDTKVISGSDDRTLILRNLNKLGNFQVLTGHTDVVYTIDVFRGLKIIVSGSRNGDILFWKEDTLENIKKMTYESTINILVCSKSIFYAGVGKSLYIIDLNSNYKTTTVKGVHNSDIKSIILSSNEIYIITCSTDTFVRIFEVSSNLLYASLSGHTKEVLSVSITSDNNHILSGSRDNSIILWNIKSKSKIHQFNFHLDSVTGLFTYSDFIISVSSDSRIGVSRILSKTFETFFYSKAFKVYSESIQGDMISFGSLENVILVDNSKIESETVLSGHPELVLSTCLSSDLNYLISSSKGISDNLILWDVQRKIKRTTLSGHQGSVLCVDISKDSQKAISGDINGVLRIWDLKSLKQECFFREHRGNVLSVKFTKNKKYSVSAGIDQKVIVWDILKNVCFRTFNNNSVIERVWMTGDDKYIVFASTYFGVSVLNYLKKAELREFRDENEMKKWLYQDRSLEFELTRYLF